MLKQEGSSYYHLPCSIFQIYLVSVDGKSVEAVLYSGEGIHKPTRLSVDKAGQRLVVINRSGIELRVYQILTTT